MLFAHRQCIVSSVVAENETENKTEQMTGADASDPNPPDTFDI